MHSKQGEFTIVPILVGSLQENGEKMYGQLFSKYLAEPENLFVISSDFCHWGELRLSHTAAITKAITIRTQRERILLVELHHSEYAHAH